MLWEKKKENKIKKTKTLNIYTVFITYSCYSRSKCYTLVFCEVILGRVEMGKEKGKKSLILKTLERCRSIGGHRKGEKRYMAPEGCFSVYVGPAKERFVVRMECINHPLFQMLLDQAEMEYGYATDGPLELPCNVDLFNRVLWEMEQESVAGPPRYTFTRTYSGYSLLSPSRPMVIGRY